MLCAVMARHFPGRLTVSLASDSLGACLCFTALYCGLQLGHNEAEIGDSVGRKTNWRVEIVEI